jgi:hypothetical protein
MPDDQSPPAPITPFTSPDAPLPRAALERVLARATELQAQGAEGPEVISEARLLEIGREVGIDPNHLRLAIAEERGRSPMLAEEPGRIALALGEAHAGAQRAVTGDADKVLAALDQWLQREEQFAVKRRFGTRMSWEKQRNAFAAISRSMSGRNSDLSRADEVSATVTPVDATRSLVRLDADLRLQRQAHRNGGIALAAINGVLLVGWMVPMVILTSVSQTAPNVALMGLAGVTALGVQAGVSTLIWRSIKHSFRSAVARTQLRLEQLLDALEHGDTGSPPTLLEQLRQQLIPPKR